MRQSPGLLILVGWPLFGWAAVLRWLKQGPPLALTILTRVMQVLALTAMVMDVSDGVLTSLGGSWGIDLGGVRVVDAIAQALAVMVCVEAVSNPNPARLIGLLGNGPRVLQVMARATLAAQLVVQSLAIVLSGEVSALSLAGRSARWPAGSWPSVSVRCWPRSCGREKLACWFRDDERPKTKDEG